MNYGYFMKCIKTKQILRKKKEAIFIKWWNWKRKTQFQNEVLEYYRQHSPWQRPREHRELFCQWQQQAPPHDAETPRGVESRLFLQLPSKKKLVSWTTPAPIINKPNNSSPIITKKIEELLWKKYRERDLGDSVAEFFGMSSVVSAHSNDLSPHAQ